MNKTNKLWILFSSTFAISALTSGGYVIVSMMRKKFVDQRHWLEEDEMLDLTSIAQSTPGPVAVNASILVGYRISGLSGALITMLGTILPPLIIMSIVAVCYQVFCSNLYVRYFLKGMQAGVAALIFNVVIDLFHGVFKQKSWLSNLLMLGAFLLNLFTEINVFWIALFCAGAGIIKTLLLQKKSQQITPDSNSSEEPHDLP